MKITNCTQNNMPKQSFGMQLKVADPNDICEKVLPILKEARTQLADLEPLEAPIYIGAKYWNAPFVLWHRYYSKGDSFIRSSGMDRDQMGRDSHLAVNTIVEKAKEIARDISDAQEKTRRLRLSIKAEEDGRDTMRQQLKDAGLV